MIRRQRAWLEELRSKFTNDSEELLKGFLNYALFLLKLGNQQSRGPLAEQRVQLCSNIC